MGCHASRLAVTEGSSNTKTAKHEDELISSYGEACSLIPELRSFDALQKLKKFAVKDRDLLLLSKAYLDNATATLNLLAALKSSLSEARNGHAIALQAVKCYERKSFAQTLSKLKEFKEAGSPFASLLTSELSSLCERQKSILKELASAGDKIRERLSSVKKWKKLCKVVHNIVFFSVVILSVVLAAVSAPSVATAAATSGGTMIKTAEQWFDSIWAKRLGALKGEKAVVLAMTKGGCGVHELETIQAVVKRLEMRIGSMWGDAAFAVNHEELGIAVSMAMEEIEGKVGEVEEWIGEGEMKVEACGGVVKKAMFEFLNVVVSENL